MDTPTAHPQIAIYSTPTCHFCHMAKQFLTEHQVLFTNYDVSTDAEKRQEMIEMTGQLGVPVITITPVGTNEPHVIIGFDKEKLAELAGISV